MKKLFVLLLTIVICLGFCGCREEIKASKNNKKASSTEKITEIFDFKPIKIENVKPLDESIVNIALFGVDCREEGNFTGLTDTIMILSVNKKTKNIKLFSIMRDTLVPIVDENGQIKGCGKINSAFASGGADVTKSAKIAINTLNSTYKLDISEFMVVNLYGMTEIIDAVGGVTATITQDELTWKGIDRPNLNGCMDEICKEKGLNPKIYYITNTGTQTLNGIQAVAYARIKSCENEWGTCDEFGRTDRQRHMMLQLFNRAITMNKAELVHLIDSLIPYCQTSLAPNTILDLATGVLLQQPKFEHYRIPLSQYQNDFLMRGPQKYGSVIYYDIDYAAELINSIIYNNQTIEEFIAKNPIRKNDWFAQVKN